MAEFSNPAEVETGGIKAFSVLTQTCDGDGFDHTSTTSAAFSLGVPSHNARIIHGPSLFLRICVNTNSGLAISTFVAQVICSSVVRVLFSFSSKGPSTELPPWWRAALVVAEMPTMSWTSLSIWRTIRCGVFVHGNVARRAGNSVDSLSRAGVWEHCGSTCRFDEPVFAGLRHFPEGALQGPRRLDTSPGALPSRPQTTQVPRCSAQLSSLMNRRPSIHANA